MNKRIFGFLFLMGLMLPVAANADAINPAFEFTSNSQSTGTDYSFGVVFTPSTNIYVNYVGYYDPRAG